MLPAEIYKDLEAQILEQIRDGDREQLKHLVGDHDLDIEFLSGEWRIMMSEFEDHYQVVDLEKGMARMVVSPDELEEFVEGLRDPQRQQRWGPISFGLAELTDALPAGTDLVAVVLIEESDDWMWTEPVYELVAIRPEVFELLEPHLRAQLATGDWGAMARLAEDHAEGCVEFSPEQWRVLMRHSHERVPELISVYEGRLAVPADYTHIREALSLVADPRYQPSLDAWLRVHANSAQYALYFRDASLERREFEASGLFKLSRSTQKMKRVPGPGEEPPPPAERPIVPEEIYQGGQTVPLKPAERERTASNTGKAEPPSSDEE
jgi:hypothetical protein